MKSTRADWRANQAPIEGEKCRNTLCISNFSQQKAALDLPSRCAREFIQRFLKNNYRPRVLDLFCGAGGMSLGFEQAGFDIVAGIEIDPVHAAVHSYNFPSCRVYREDVGQIEIDEIYIGCQ